jgi:septal ring-binding cell division protein DamX
MKTNLRIFSAVLLIAIITLVASCKKDNSTTSNSSNNDNAAANMSSNGASADNAYDDAFGVAVQAGSDQNLDMAIKNPHGAADVAQSIEGNYYCANVTVTGSSFPITITLDFGTGCESADSVTRSGSVTYVFSGRLSTPGTTITATFDNYSVNGYVLNGTYTIANTTTDINAPQVTTTVTGGNIKFPSDTSYSFSGTKTIALSSGSLSNVSSLVFSITGNYQISSSYGDSLAATITTPLERKLTCRYIDQGVISFTYTKGTTSVSGTLDFGDGTCDNSAVVTIGSYMKTITFW